MYTKELNDLKEIYARTVKELNPRYENALEMLIHTMKKFIEVNEANTEWKNKLQTLEYKMKYMSPDGDSDCGDCDCDDDDDE